eukprot:TRINITY_DN6446_c1_g1_i3.p1 TRINITY_DN6446_c1_g1~~TRINITY_DN6446_c1_g1_i3.p1  ORF type:complete len:326 (-),score=74.40 TRINITY_DN6446_c1_g1_i3:34-1011(-)
MYHCKIPSPSLFLCSSALVLLCSSALLLLPHPPLPIPLNPSLTHHLPQHNTHSRFTIMGFLSWYVSILYPIDLSETAELIISLVCVALILKLVKLYVEGPSWTPVDLNGKVAIVTGANTGIGKVTACELTRAGASVILACRNKDKAAKAISDIKEEIVAKGMFFDKSRKPKLQFIQLDLASFESVGKFVETFDEEWDGGDDGDRPLDILINNAGCMAALRKTKDGCDIQMQANHLGHYLLTNLMLKNLAAAEQGRIVNVSSVVHSFGTFDVNDPNMFHEPPSVQLDWLMYARTKLCNVLFTYHLARELSRIEGNKITVNALHPGV